MTTPLAADNVLSRSTATRAQKLDLSPVPPARHAEYDEEVVLTSSIPAMDITRASMQSSFAGSYAPLPAVGAGNSGVSGPSQVSADDGDADPSVATVNPSVGAESVYADSVAGGADDDDKDLATARPSHRRLAEFTPNLRSWDQGHRIEVFLRIR